MSAAQNGGFAFPGLNAEFTGIGSEGQERYEIQPSGGMTLRDYFAVHATTDDVAAQTYLLRARTDFGILPDNYVTLCRYMHADAMLEARK